MCRRRWLSERQTQGLRKENKIVYADYYPLLVHGEDRALNPQYTHDGVHPTEKGYEVMEKYIQGILKKLL